MLTSVEYFDLPQSFTYEIWFKYTEPLDNKVNPEYYLLKLYSPSYYNEERTYISLSIQWGMGFVLQFQEKKEMFDPKLNFEKEYVNRWSFVGFSVMNLNDAETKVCFAFPPKVFDCRMKYLNMRFN